VQAYNDNFEWTGKVYIGISLSCWTVAIMNYMFRKQKEVRKVINIANKPHL